MSITNILPGPLVANCLVIACVVGAGFLVLSYYPGSFYYDVVHQYNYIDSLGSFRLPSDFSSWWPLPNVLARLPLWLITREPGLILFAVLFFYFWPACRLIKLFDGTGWTLIAFVLFCAVTPFTAWLVLHGPHTMVAALLVLAAALLIEGRPAWAGAALSATVLFRADAVLLALAAIFALALMRAVSWRAAAVGVAVVLLAFGMASIKLDNPRDPNNGLTPANDGLVHATLAVLARNPKLGAGDPDLMALYRYIPQKYDLLCSLSMWCSTSRAAVDLDAVRKPAVTSTLIKANLRFLLDDPVLTVQVWTARIWMAATLKLAPHELGRADILPWSRIDIIRASATEANRALVERHTAFYGRFGVVYAPGLFLGVWLAAGALARSRVLLGLALAAIVVFPLKVFLLPTQEVRYYFPEITMALIVMLIAIPANLRRLRFGSGSSPSASSTSIASVSSSPNTR